MTGLKPVAPGDAFVTELARHAKVSTIERRLAWLSRVHGGPARADNPVTDPLVRQV